MGGERPLVGRIIDGKYRVIRPIGAGAWAQVFLAEHAQLQFRVAVKVLSNWQRCSDKQLERFVREGRAAGRLRSVHVCRVLDFGRTEDGAPYSVLEYLEGTDLQHVLDEHGALDPKTAVEYVLQACEGLAEAHASGVVHRDLKPANLFLTSAPDGAPLVKILDFGISKITGHVDLELTRSGEALGTPHYMSPEQLRDAADVDARSDIWSLGVILWRMISGEVPFAAASFADLCIAVVSGGPPERGRAAIPPELAARLLPCLEREPSRRYQDIARLAAALSDWLAHDELTVVRRIGRVLDRIGGGERTAGSPATEPTIAAEPTAAQDPTIAMDPPTEVRARARSRRRLGIAAAAMISIAIAGLAIAAIAGGDTPAVGTPPAELTAPQTRPAIVPASATASTAAVSISDDAVDAGAPAPSESPRAKARRRTRSEPSRAPRRSSARTKTRGEAYEHRR